MRVKTKDNNDDSRVKGIEFFIFPVLGFHADFWSKIRVSIEIRCRQVSNRS